MKRIAIFCILSLTSVFADVKIGTLATKGWVGGQITSSQNSTDEKIARINNRIDTIEYASRPNMNVVGSPIFVQGSVSGFSANDYMVFPSNVSVGTNTVEFYMGFTTGSDVTTKQNILDSNCGLAFAISNGYTITSISYDGSTFVNSRSSANTVSPNTSYWLKLVFRKSGGNYFSETFLGTRRDNMTQRGSGIQTGLPLVAKPTYWGGANPQTGVHNIFKGTINLNECSLYFNGKEVWSGYDTIPNDYVSFNPNSPSILNTADKIVDEVQRRIGDVNRPYTMIYDPTSGRALTADGRLMNYGNAPKITGKFTVNRVTDESNSELPNGFMPTLANLPHDELEEGVDWFSTITPSVPDGNGGYYNATATISWATSSSGNSILPVTASIEKVVSSFGTQTSLNVNTLGYSYFTVNVPDLGEGEVSIYESYVDGNKVYLYWNFYDYNYWGYYSGTDVFELQFVDEGGNGVQPVVFGDRGKFATVEDMGVIVTDEVSRQFNDVDFVRSKKMLRTGKKMEYGDGWGYIRYDFTTDNRWWEIKVPNLTANVTANSYPYNTIAKPYVSERVFIKSSGTNGVDRCKSSVWNIVLHFTDLDIEIGDITITNGIGITSFTPRIPGGNFYYKSSSEFCYDLTVSSISYLPSSSVTIGLTYKYRSYSSTVYTGNASITLTSPSNSYTLVTPDYYRNIGGENHHMFWDEAMKCTWNVAVSNGSFFAEVVSTNNLLSSGH